MFNRNAGDEIARRFKEIMTKNASQGQTDQSVPEMPSQDPADYLVAPTNEDKDLDPLGDIVLEYEEDGELEEEDFSGNGEQDAVAGNLTLTDEQKRIIKGLGEVRASLISKGKAFAANAVDVTYLEIKNNIKRQNIRKLSAAKYMKKITG